MRKLSFDDQAQLAGDFSEQQLETLTSPPVPIPELETEGKRVRRLLSFFRLWNSLSTESRQEASAGAVPMPRLSPAQRMDVTRSAAIASPSSQSLSLNEGGFQVMIQGAAATVYLQAAPPSRTVRELRIIP